MANINEEQWWHILCWILMFLHHFCSFKCVKSYRAYHLLSVFIFTCIYEYVCSHMIVLTGLWWNTVHRLFTPFSVFKSFITGIYPLCVHNKHLQAEENAHIACTCKLWSDDNIPNIIYWKMSKRAVRVCVSIKRAQCGKAVGLLLS